MTAAAFADGVLYFPVTPYGRDGAVATGVLTELITERLADRPGGIFAACGTGEFHALSAAEVGRVVGAAVTAIGDHETPIPVISGTGGPFGHALDCARAAADNGADALLVLPPYLVGAPTDGLIRYVETIVERSGLPVIVYHRANAVYSPSSMRRLAADSRVIGFKDGVGDLAESQRIVLAVTAAGRSDFAFFNGLLTAELSQAAYRSIGVPHYSSAVFAMAPKIANAFYDALVSGDEQRRIALLAGFYEPLVALRDQVPGCAVALIKAGVGLGRADLGGVRPPLLDPTPEHLSQLREILAQGHDLIG